MLDHLSLGVRDLSIAEAYYTALFAPLGYRCQRSSASELAFGTDADWGFWLYPADPDAVLSGARAHSALRAATPDAVIAAHAAGLAAGGQELRAPGLRPDVSPRYFGSIQRDPDGHMIELVTWLPETGA